MGTSFIDNTKKCAGEVSDKLLKGMVGWCGGTVKVAQENANQTPPNHPQVVTGTLRRSIIMDVEEGPEKITGKVGFIRGKEEGENADTVLEYAPLIEALYPFLVPAAESMKDKAKDYFL